MHIFFFQCILFFSHADHFVKPYISEVKVITPALHTKLSNCCNQYFLNVDINGAIVMLIFSKFSIYVHISLQIQHNHYLFKIPPFYSKIVENTPFQRKYIWNDLNYIVKFRFLLGLSNYLFHIFVLVSVRELE